MQTGLHARLSNLLSPRGHAMVAWLILGVGLALSVLLTIATRWQLEREAQRQFEFDAQDILHRVQNELGSYEEVLVGLRAFLASREVVTRSEFRRYVEHLDLARRYPAFENLNYAQLVKAADLRRFEDAVRHDRSVHPGGYPSFRVVPEGQRAEYHVITYIEPWERSSASFGRDIAMSSPAALRTLERQRDTGEVISSGRLIRIEGPNRHIGIAMRLAVYKPGAVLDSVEARRAAFRGSVGAGYRVAAVMRMAVSGEHLRDIRFLLVDQGAENAQSPQRDRVLFDSDELRAPSTRGAAVVDAENAFRHNANFSVAGRAWQIQFTAPKQASGAIGPVLPLLVLAACVLSTLLVFGLFRSLASYRQRAEDLARAITADLRQSEASLAAAQRMAHLGDWHLELSDQTMRYSLEASELLGLDREAACATLQSFLDRVHSAEREEVRFAIERCATEGKAFDMEHRIVVAGAERWVHARGEPRTGPSGRIGVIHGTIMDINERKLATRRKEMEAALAGLFASGRSTDETMEAVIRIVCAECGFNAGHYAPEAEQAPPADALALPLTVGDARLGTITLFGRPTGSVDPDLRKMLGDVAAQVAQYLLRRRAEDNFKHLAMHDPLTGLPNRLFFGERIAQAIRRAERTPRGLAVLFIDLDRFKNVNDTLGHGAGDAVLKACADRLGRCLREADLVARISGDEFAVLLEPCDRPEAAAAIARRMLAAIERPLVVQGHEIVLTGSMGISVYHEDGRDPETLLKHADIAMFRAKEQGRNNYQFYSPQMNPHSVERLTLEAALRRALERAEFSLQYQPKFNLKTGQITGVEALLRWRHPELGNVSPAQFIPIAEETGLIEPIGAWVLNEACAQAARWHREGRSVRVAVNLSARQFRNQKLGRDIGSCLADNGLQPQYLELELTESMVMQNPEQAATMLNELKSLGLSLSIDDFGTGYSSLAYLKRFPIDSVKVDRSFVKGIPSDAEDVAIVQAVIALAHSLGLRVVAEGVETEEQHSRLRVLGCDEMQGYYKSKPLPAEEITRLLADGSAERRAAERAPLSAVA